MNTSEKEMIRACKSGDISKDVCKVVLLRQDIIAEHDASNIYDVQADYFESVGEYHIASVLRDVSDEEEVHVGEFEELLSKENQDYRFNILEGNKEIEK